MGIRVCSWQDHGSSSLVQRHTGSYVPLDRAYTTINPESGQQDAGFSSRNPGHSIQESGMRITIED